MGDSDFVFVFNDESYANVNNCEKRAFIPIQKDAKTCITRKSLIILHGIGENGPLVQNNDNIWYLVDDLKWRKDTPHPKNERMAS